jgi:C1A family cysteine protease
VKGSKPKGVGRAPLNPHFKPAGQSPPRAAQAGARLPGFIHPPLKLKYLKRTRTSFAFASGDLPGTYDLRKKERVSPVKDQDGSGTCWAFATYGSLESCLLPEEKWDFSENNMKNLLSRDCPQGYDREPDGGGNQYMSTAYLTRWGGPVNESDDPFEPLAPADCSVFPIQKQVLRVLFLPDRQNATDNDSLKTAIMSYGAVFTSIYFEDESYQDQNYTYYYQGKQAANHAVCLVGWDDRFDRNLFRDRPPQDGAFIAKNSWGTDWGEQGYFYVSYYDAVIGSNNAVFNRSENPSAYSLIYQNDPWGWVTSVGYGQTSGWLANLFKSSQKNRLQAVSWYAASPLTTYELYIYQNPSPGQPRSGKLLQTLKGSIEVPSYFTRFLSSPLELQAGDVFSLVLLLNTPDYRYPIPTQMAIEGYSSQARSESATSYISSDGQTWDDITVIWANSSVCLKGLGTL